ncbi:hypothetical protein CVT24_012530 [Panaeolus cyanescens]|uniref:Conidiation protein 6 n=1 Tax=Panaeolus cyanescens TaxID=181874 RepID=A0A409YK67_9AGAR|nr:hypothetical protein CVT24_012530 [Panaeolus cyanescens]
MSGSRSNKTRASNAPSQTKASQQFDNSDDFDYDDTEYKADAIDEDQEIFGQIPGSEYEERGHNPGGASSGTNLSKASHEGNRVLGGYKATLKIISKLSDITQIIMSFEQNQARGYKATLHNPRVSDEAKQNAQQHLNELGSDQQATSYTQSRGMDEISESVRQGKEEARVIAGYKAVLQNPNVSSEARQHAEEVLQSHNVKSPSSGAGHAQPSHHRGHEDNVNRGYKATLHNPRVSDEARERAEEYLEQHNAM